MLDPTVTSVPPTVLARLAPSDMEDLIAVVVQLGTRATTVILALQGIIPTEVFVLLAVL